MAEYDDIYALAGERTPEIIQTFIAHFVPDNSTSDRLYEYSLRAAVDWALERAETRGALETWFGTP